MGIGLSVQQTGAGNGLSVTKSAGDASSAMIVTNYDSGAAIFVPQNGNGVGLRIDKTNTGNANCLTINNSGTGSAVYINQIQTAATGVPALFVDAYNTSSGRGVRIDYRGTDSALYANKVGVGAGNVIDISNSGSGFDIAGNSNNWHVSKLGAAVFQSLLIHGLPTFHFLGGRSNMSASTGVFTSGPVACGIGSFTVSANSFNNGIIVFAWAELTTEAISSGVFNIALEVVLTQGITNKRIAPNVNALDILTNTSPGGSGFADLGGAPLYIANAASPSPTNTYMGHTLLTVGVWAKSGFALFGMGGSDWNPAASTSIDFGNVYVGKVGGGGQGKVGGRGFLIAGF